MHREREHKTSKYRRVLKTNRRFVSSKPPPTPARVQEAEVYSGPGIPKHCPVEFFGKTVRIIHTVNLVICIEIKGEAQKKNARRISDRL